MAGIELTSDPSCSAASEAVNDESLRATGMHPRLLEACRAGNCGLFDYLYDHLVGPNILKDKTPYGNTALHLSVMLGHDTFARKVWFREPLLLTSLNNDGETPLIAALMAGNSSMARALIAAAAASSTEPPDHDLERAPQNHLCEMLEMADLCGQNALHHALRSMPNQDVALHILDKVRDHQETVVRLSSQVSKNGESPMHIACRRGYPDVVEELLTIPESSDKGPTNTTAMHTAVVAQQIEIVNKLLKKRPHLACKLCNGHTPLTLAIATDNLEMVETFMRHDPSLAYINCGACSSEGKEEENEKDDDSHECTYSPFILAVSLGRVEIAKEIASRCPDSAYYRSGTNRVNALHRAIDKEHPKMVEYLLSTPRFRRLINQSDSSGKLPLHCAAGMCNTELLRPLLNHEVQDCTAVTADNKSAVDLVYSRNDLYTTRKWNDAYTLLSHQICFRTSDLSDHRAKKKMNLNHVQQEQKKMGYLMPQDKYAKNASLVAILIITITFVAVFSTVRVSAAGYSSAANYNGLPASVLATKQVPFKVFLVTYTIAMLSSLAVCFSATYIQEDYKALARMLSAFAYVATTVAFVSGLCLVSPMSLWLVLVTVITVALICIIAILIRFRFNIFGIWPRPVSRCFSQLPHFLPPRY